MSCIKNRFWNEIDIKLERFLYVDLRKGIFFILFDILFYNLGETYRSTF